MKLVKMKSMKATKNAVVACVLFCSTHIFAGQKVNETKDASEDSIVKIEHLTGKAEIKGWNKKQVKVEGELGENTKDFQFTRNGKTIEIIVKVEKKSWSSWGSSHADGDELVIYVPKNSRVDYRTTNADVEISDVSGGTDIDVINGRIEASNLQGRIRLETVNGDVRARELAGDVVIDAVNGDIDVEHTSGENIRIEAVNGDVEFNSKASDVKVETVNGDMNIKLDTAMDLNMETVNGSIDASVSLDDGGYIKASSVGGSIDLNLDKDIQAKFDIESHAGGRIRNKFNDVAPQKAKYGPRRWLEFSTGDPTGTVEVSTVNGTVTLDKR